MARRPVHFVLDHNFPWQVTGLEWPPYITITTLKDIDPRLIQDHEDWEVLRALAARGGIDGYVTNDAKMLALPREMLALTETRFALIVAGDEGHNAIRSTALVMLYLEQVVTQLTGKPQIFLLRAAAVSQGLRDPHKLLNDIADHHNVPRADMIREERAEMALHTEKRRLLEAQRAAVPPVSAETPPRRRSGRRQPDR